MVGVFIVPRRPVVVVLLLCVCFFFCLVFFRYHNYSGPAAANPLPAALWSCVALRFLAKNIAAAAPTHLMSGFKQRLKALLRQLWSPFDVGCVCAGVEGGGLDPPFPPPLPPPLQIWNTVAE